MQLSPSVLAEEIAGASILLGILIGHECIEDGDDLTARFIHDQCRDDEDEIVSPDVADESFLTTHPFYDVVKDLREQIDVAACRHLVEEASTYHATPLAQAGSLDTDVRFCRDLREVEYDSGEARLSLQEFDH